MACMLTITLLLVRWTLICSIPMDQHEYILIARIANGDGSNEPVLMVVNDEGEVLKEYRGDETKGDYFNGNVMDINTNNPRLLVVYYSFETDVHTIETYALPFSRFTGGTGNT